MAENSALSKVTDSSFEADVLASPIPVVVDFWAEWCGPCKMIAPALEEIAGQMKGKVTIAKLNVDENTKVPGQFGIRSIPTLIMFSGGQVVAQKVGAGSKTDIANWIAKSLPAQA
jgi:thioredoxin 1